MIEWISKAIAYSLNATNIIYNKLSDFIRSRASISKKLKEDLDKMLKSSSDTFYVDTSAYNKILAKNGLLFSYYMGGNLGAKEIEGTDALMNRLSVAIAITKSKLEVQNFLKIFQDILKEFSISRLPNVVKDGDKTISIVSDGKDINGVEKFLTDIVFGKLGRSMTVGDFRGVWLPSMLTTGESELDRNKEISINEFNYSKTRMIIHSAYNTKTGRFADYASFILYSKQNLSIAALSAVELDFSNSAKDLEINTAISTGNIKPYLFKKEIEELYKSVEKSIEVLKKMPSESSSRLDKINKYLKDNIESMKKEGMAEGDNHGAIFNPELKMKLKMIIQQQFFFPSIVSMTVVGIVWSFVFNPTRGILNHMLDLFHLSTWKHAWLGEGKTALWCIGAALVWQAIGYYMVMHVASIDGISQEVYEAASIDGATGVQKFFRITIPLLRRSIGTTYILSLSGTINLSFTLSNVMTGGGPNGASSVLLQYMYTQGMRNANFGYAMAIAMFTLILAIVLAMISKKVSSEKE